MKAWRAFGLTPVAIMTVCQQVVRQLLEVGKPNAREIGGARFAAGNQVITRVNDRANKSYNRERWEIAEVNAKKAKRRLGRIDQAKRVEVRPEYLARTNPYDYALALQHAYAGHRLLRPGHHGGPRLRDGRSCDGQARRSTSPPRAAATRPTSTRLRRLSRCARIRAGLGRGPRRPGPPGRSGRTRSRADRRARRSAAGGPGEAVHSRDVRLARPGRRVRPPAARSKSAKANTRRRLPTAKRLRPRRRGAAP